MELFRRILIGVDLSLAGDRLTLGSARAVEQGLWIAERTSAEVVFLHSTWADMHEEEQAIRPGPSSAGRVALEELVARAAQLAVRARLALVPDRAWIEIIRLVQRGEADLVLVGRRNQEGSDTLLGGVARKLMRKCPCPVWVVKPEGHLELRSIAAATDLTEVGHLAVDLAASLAKASGGELHVIHAWTLPSSAPVLAELDLPPQSRVQVQELEHAAGERLRHSLGLRELPIEPRVHLACGAPSAVIRDHIERLSVDLLVMGSVSRGGIAGLLLGNTAERLLDRVQCSQLTIKPRDFISPVR